MSPPILSLPHPTHHMPMPTVPLGLPLTPTPDPSPTLHDLSKRHFYLCGGQTLSWRSEWYTQPWFTSSRAAFDSAASLGPVSPPGNVIATVPACQAALSASSLQDALSEGRVSVVTTSVTRDGGDIVPVTSTEILSEVSGSSTTWSKTSASATATAPTSHSPSMTGSVTTLVSTVSAAAASSSDPMRINSCAGDWDWQAWGAIASLGVGVILGGVFWVAWLLLRGRIPGLYSPRTWFMAVDKRPSKAWSLATLFLPFLHLPSLRTSTPLSSAHLALPLLFSLLKLAALTSLLALASLPLLIAGVPCLSSTAPSNSLGGRLGAFTDLSLLRLLDALDPSPNSFETSSFLHLTPYLAKRNLPSTIRSAVGSARVRLIVLLVIIGVLAVGGGLFVIARTYASLARYRRTFQDEICKGVDMVYLPAERTAGLRGMNEEKARRWFAERLKLSHNKEASGKPEVEVVGVFGVPDISQLAKRVKDRERALHQLEEAEADRIHSLFTGDHDPSTFTAPFRRVSLRNRYQPLPDQQPRPSTPLQVTFPQRPVSTTSPPSAIPAHELAGGVPTKFVEINRDSTTLSGRDFEIGQRVKVNDEGKFVPDPSPDSDRTDPLGSSSGHGHDSSEAAPRSGEAVRQTPSSSREEASPPNEPVLRPGPERRPEMSTVLPPQVSSERPSREGQASSVVHATSRISECRETFISMNEEVEKLQRQAFERVAKGEDIRGWIVVGRGVRWLPGAEEVEGRSKEDILWERATDRGGHGERGFWIKVLLMGIVLGLLMTPFIGLTVGTAPGFAQILGILRWLANSNGLGAGVLEGLVPALAMTLLATITVALTDRFAKKVATVSRTRQDLLAYKATFYLLLGVCVLWLVLASSLEFAVQGFETGVQEARVVGDGTIYSTWFVFVLLLNLAIIFPGLALLRPIRLWRYFRRRAAAKTPRQRFRRRLPTTFRPCYLLPAPLLAVFYALTLLFLFPLLAVPILLLLYLSFVAIRHLADHVYVDRYGSFTGATLGLWTVRRLGWVLPVQPALFGLIMLSRREWALGGAALGVAMAALGLSEALTVRLHPNAKWRDLSQSTRIILEKMRVPLSTAPDVNAQSDQTANDIPRQPRYSDGSMLQRLNALLPGYSRLPPDCPLPLESENIDDLFFTERAADTFPAHQDDGEEERPKYFYDPTESLRGLIYPPEMLAPTPVIWLPRGGEGEANELQRDHKFAVIVDSAGGREDQGLVSSERKTMGQEDRTTVGREVGRLKFLPAGRPDS